MKLRVSIGLLLSLIFIYLSFWKPDISGLLSGETGLFSAFWGQTRIDLKGLGVALSKAHYGYVILGITLLLLSLFSRAQRWRIMIKPVYAEIRYWPVYSAMNIGYMINNILPLRMGEILRAYFLGKAEKISKTSVLATIVVERLLDSTAILILLSVTLFFFPFPDWIRNGLFYIGSAAVFLIAFLLGLLFATDWTIGILRTVLKPIPQRISHKIIRMVEGFASGLEVMRSSRHYAAILMHTVLLEACYILSVLFTLLAFDLISPDYPAIDANPLLASIVLLIIITIGIGLPSAPGAVGTFHGIVALGVSLFGVSAEASMGLAIVLHLANYIPLTVLGLVCFWTQQFKLSEIKEQFQKGET
ncbi:hypothetical protein CEE37_08685 [candidate division LCP-89 bacterium B3_LCP]|uniref:TIGR00374 family protein n=1 Tax=candidate division LCP-89 bacterium B3_LCP TaxID=2012998 RepID=A0A532UZP4_UNCL8|nr:MAG: hypothetical protein CEE37_08685 [candidate division LCP-89 bacterium B3_LCP]